jgi:outer membrane protein assembly factor BamB
MKNSLLLAVITLLLMAGCTDKNNIAQFRGANRDGIYKESGLLKAWPAEGPKLLWETEVIGHGYGSPVVSGNTLYVNGEADSISYLFAFDLKGNLLWKSPNGREFYGDGFSAGFPGARSTPTVYKGMVYVNSGLGRIACFDALSGKEIWATEMVKDLGGALNYFGYCESLLVDEKNVYCFPGGKESNVMELDRLTGKKVWTSKALADEVAFTSPMIINLPGKKLFVTVSKNNLFALDALNGELLWSVKEDSVKFEGAYCNTPLYSEGFIYEISGVEKGSGAFKLKLSDDGKTVTQVWKNSNVKNETGGFIKIGDKIFSSSDDKKLKCLDSNTGAVTDSIKNLRGALIYADNKLYCYGDNGNMNLIGLNGSKMELISKFKVEKGTKEHLAHPVINDGVLYIRHGKALMAYQIN